MKHKQVIQLSKEGDLFQYDDDKDKFVAKLMTTIELRTEDYALHTPAEWQEALGKCMKGCFEEGMAQIQKHIKQLHRFEKLKRGEAVESSVTEGDGRSS